jgi:hypothetical protein
VDVMGHYVDVMHYVDVIRQVSDAGQVMRCIVNTGLTCCL